MDTNYNYTSKKGFLKQDSVNRPMEDQTRHIRLPQRKVRSLDGLASRLRNERDASKSLRLLSIRGG